MSVEQRTALRRQLRSKRRMLPRYVQQQASTALLRHCRHWSPFVRARAVAFYLPVPGEISPLPLMHRAHALGKRCYLPRIRPFPANTLEFRRWRPGQRLYRQRWRLREPRGGARRAVAQLDLIFMPLTGLDRRGHRLGMGGGYYDRTLAGLPGKPLRVGLAHDCQVVEQVPSEAWDIRLHAAVTPSGRLIFSPACGRRTGG